MINSEKELEDYICNNQERFIRKLKEMFGYNNIVFIGRQIKIGSDNIADLVYMAEENEELAIRDLIIVELKFRKLVSKDLEQLARYMCVFEEKDNNINFECVKGCFVSFGCSDEMINISKTQENIKFISIKSELTFNEEAYCYTDEYLENLELDNRLLEYMEN